MSLETAANAAEKRQFSWRMSLFFFGYFCFGGVVLPFFPVWLQARGLTEVQIASCIALPALGRVLLTPLAGLFADRAPNRRFAIICLTVPAALIFFFAGQASGYVPILLITGAAFTAQTLAQPAAEALALTGMRRLGLDYGRLRVSGSIAFIVTNLGSGALLSLLYPGAIFWLIAGTLVISVAVAFALPVTPKAVRRADDAARPDARPVWRVLARPGFLALILVGALVQASHAVLYSFGSIHWRALGFDGIEVGAFWAIGIVVEVTVFSFSGVLVRRFGPLGLMAIGACAAIIRWAAAAQDPGFLGFLALQSLHGLTFGAVYLGNQHAIARAVPEEMTASAQGIYAMITGVIMAGTTQLAGTLYQSYGAEAYLFMIALPVVALLILAGYAAIGQRRRR